ncbi:MAG: trypsin-like peptidase domain-containing protein [Bacteroidota bacterium]
MKIQPLFFLFLTSLLFTSCVSVLRTKTETVVFDKEAADTKVYLDGEKVDEGSESFSTEMIRDRDYHRIEVEREGYKTAYSVISNQREAKTLRNLPTLTAIVTGTVTTIITEDLTIGGLVAGITQLGGVVLLAVDDLDRTFSYPRSNYLPAPQVKLVTREEEGKYLFSQEIELDLAEDSYEFYRTNERGFRENKEELITSLTNTEAIQLENTIFTDAINSYLLEAGFMDTSRTILKMNGTTNYLNAKIQQIQTYLIQNDGLYYVTSDVSVEWNMVNVYGKSLYINIDEGSSGNFSHVTQDTQDDITYSIQDAMEVSLLKFLNRAEVQDLLQKKDLSTELLDPITLNQVQNAPRSLSEAQQATVTIKVDEGHGSGFFVSEDGFLLTNYHVVATTEDTLKVLTSDGNSYEAVLIRKDEQNDLALLKADVVPSYAFRLPTDKNYQIGAGIFAIGTPRAIELGQTLSKGIISGQRKVGQNELLQTDASINFGNSGGPIVNENGELIGIINSKLVGLGVEGIAFGTPAHVLTTYLSLNVE